MELQLALKGMEITRKKTKWVVLLAAFGLTSYGFYRVHHLPAIAQKRKRVLKLLAALISMAEAVSDCSETIGAVSKDLKHFLQSESDQIPNSLKQASKITRSDEFSESITRITQASTVGILQGYQSEARSGDGPNPNPASMADKLFSKAGTGFASVVAGSLARNLVLALSSRAQSDEELKSNANTLNMVSSDKCRELIGDCIQLFVSSMVSLYLEKTKHVNSYDELFTGLTNPKHETQVREVLVTVCNSTVETLIKTSHQVLTNSAKSSPSMAIECIQDEHDPFGKLSSTLATASNRKFVLDVTGRIAFETVRSFLEFLFEMLCEGTKKCVKFAHEAVVEYVSVKSSVVAAICLSLCLHMLGCVWIAVPALI